MPAQLLRPCPSLPPSPRHYIRPPSAFPSPLLPHRLETLLLLFPPLPAPSSSPESNILIVPVFLLCGTVGPWSLPPVHPRASPTAPPPFQLLRPQLPSQLYAPLPPSLLPGLPVPPMQLSSNTQSTFIIACTAHAISSRLPLRPLLLLIFREFFPIQLCFYVAYFFCFQLASTQEKCNSLSFLLLSDI